MFSQLEKFANWLGKTPEHSKWLLTINIGSLGFIIAILFQIKAQGDIPNKTIALLASSSFILSIVAGACFYIGLALNSLAWGFKKNLRASRKLLTKTKMEKNSESKIKEFNEIAETIIKDINQKSTKREIIVFSMVFFQ